MKNTIIHKKFGNMKDFMLLWGSGALSLMGSEMTTFALTVHIWQVLGSAQGVALLKVFFYLPSILLCFAAGTLADRWDKKKTILVGVLAGGLSTAAMLTLYAFGAMAVWQLYALNFAVSMVNAFMNPALNVAVTLLSPKEQYVRVSGLTLFSAALAKIAAPALAGGLIALGGVQTVFFTDLVTFAIQFVVLLKFVHLPKLPPAAATGEGFFKSCLQGLAYLRGNRAIWKCILFFAVINLLCNMGGDGSMLPSMVLARTGGNAGTLSVVTSAAGIGLLLGSIAVTAARPSSNKARVMFFACGASFAICDLGYGLGRNAVVWASVAAVGNFLIPFITANNSAIMRAKVPVEMQGRAFAARDTVQYAPIPLGLFLGGFLADKVTEPLMATVSPLQQVLALLVGTGRGSGMALLMLLTGILGCVWSLVNARDPDYRALG